MPSTMNVLFAINLAPRDDRDPLFRGLHAQLSFTLLGLSLAVGLVVDDAVMVMENIFRHGEMGKDRMTAASDGTKEITFAALAATIAVIAIFMPVAFMSGVVGKFFLQFGVTLSVAVALSYVEAITLAPARCAQMLQTGSHETRGLVGRMADRGFDALSRGYAWALERSLRAPWLVLAAGVIVLASAGLVATQIRQEFVPSQDQSRLSVRLTTAVGPSGGDRRHRRSAPRSSSCRDRRWCDVMASVGGSANNSAQLSVTASSTSGKLQGHPEPVQQRHPERAQLCIPG